MADANKIIPISNQADKAIQAKEAHKQVRNRIK
jgi:hypothetical protein